MEGITEGKPQVELSDPFARYLSILGVEAQPPSRRALGQLARAHLIRVPFENISKLFLRKRQGATTIPSLEEFLDGVERFNMGGTCYANNTYFNLLLRQLGYEVKLCGADMSQPDVHVVTMVRVKGREYLVDVGYAAPFFEPMPRDLEQDLVVAFGVDQWVLEPQDDSGRSRMLQYRKGLLDHGYLAKPFPRSPDFFDDVIRESYQDSSTFMNAVMLVRFFEDRLVRLHNLTLVEASRDKARVRQLADRDALMAAIRKHFGIPGAVVKLALEGMGEFRDIRGLE
jgi:arylamine N-acetyltransferase